MRRVILAMIGVAVLAIAISPLGGSGEETGGKSRPVAIESPTIQATDASGGIIAASSVATSNVSSVTVAAPDGVTVRRALVKTKLALVDAVKIARDKIGAGRVVEAYFKVEDSRPLYVVEIFTSGGEHQEVVIDAVGGKIVELGRPTRNRRARSSSRPHVRSSPPRFRRPSIPQCKKCRMPDPSMPTPKNRARRLS